SHKRGASNVIGRSLASGQRFANFETIAYAECKRDRDPLCSRRRNVGWFSLCAEKSRWSARFGNYRPDDFCRRLTACLVSGIRRVGRYNLNIRAKSREVAFAEKCWPVPYIMDVKRSEEHTSELQSR